MVRRRTRERLKQQDTVRSHLSMNELSSISGERGRRPDPCGAWDQAVLEPPLGGEGGGRLKIYLVPLQGENVVGDLPVVYFAIRYRECGRVSSPDLPIHSGLVYFNTRIIPPGGVCDGILHGCDPACIAPTE